MSDDFSAPQEAAPDAREVLAPLHRRKWFIAIVVVAVTAATYAYIAKEPNVYTATTSIYVQDSQINDLLGQSAPVESTDRNTINQATLLESRAVAAAVARRLHVRGDP